ncbi:MAG: RNA 2',3'-cyclic phosphodiesterase [Candidatus Aminicenantes bacterium]|nr:MAG: RNA 2',3'-cyclic phosphodiesterase [Candidatus Aminicenantes bacterium]
MRTFVAIELDDRIKNTLSALIQKLDLGGKNVRWVKPQGMHLTLKFFGEVSEDRTAEIKSVLESIAKDYSRFSLSLKGTGTFPQGAQIPRVIWIGIEKNEALQEIQARVENEFHKIRFPKEKRKYHPHLTLGRVKGPQNLETIMETLAIHKEIEFGKMTVNKMTLFKSTLKPSGAEYTILSEFFLE